MRIGFFGPSFSVYFRNESSSHIFPNPVHPVEFLLYVQDEEVFVNTAYVLATFSEKGMTPRSDLLAEPNSQSLAMLEVRVNAAETALKAVGSSRESGGGARSPRRSTMNISKPPGRPKRAQS
jgi:hypothetical protein